MIINWMQFENYLILLPFKWNHLKMDEKPARNHRFWITHDTTTRLYITRRPYALSGAKRPIDDDDIALQNILFHCV